MVPAWIQHWLLSISFAIFHVHSVAAGEPAPAACAQPPSVTGACKADMRRWSYEPAAGRCVPFTYGGCGGTSNRFASGEQCRLVCMGIGVPLPAAADPECNGNSIRKVCHKETVWTYWLYDNATRVCRPTAECKTPGAHFFSRKECHVKCVLPTEHFATTVPACLEPPYASDTCAGASMVRYARRWSYDEAMSKCAEFAYAGCGGNGNRFRSKADCERRCRERDGGAE